MTEKALFGVILSDQTTLFSWENDDWVGLKLLCVSKLIIDNI